MKKLAICCTLISWCSISVSQPSPEIENFYNMLRKAFNEKDAYKTVGFVEQRWRLAGNTGFNESIFYVENILKDAGFAKEINGEADGPLTYRIEKRKMKSQTWEPIDATVTLNNEKTPLLSFATNRNMLAINCPSTSADGITAEIVYVGTGSKGDFEGKDVTGKIVFGETNVGALFKLAVERGAVGVLAYSLPDYVQPVKHPTSIQFQRISARANDSQFGIVLSYDAKERIRKVLSTGVTKASVKIVTKRYDAEELTLVANVRGTANPDERFVFSAHVQEPGANDNASGVGTLAEMARTTATLVRDKKFVPKRTITFLWGDEIVSTNRYITEDAQRAKGIKWGLSLDMVGEDVSKTGGSFLIEKMPDPSAIWTRGKEKHTEWGGTALKESQMFPHYFNDLVLNRCYQQAKESGWVVSSNPFEGGSDHTPFLDAKIPGLLMWHFTDVYYHTDGDRLVNVSAKEIRNVGISALATAFSLCAPTDQITVDIVREIRQNALERLQTEFELSQTALTSGGNRQEEKHILEVWSSYYEEALRKISEIPLNGSSSAVINEIEKSIKEISARNESLANVLVK